MHKRILTLPVAALIAGAFVCVIYSQEQVIISQGVFETGMQHHRRPPEEWRGKARKVTKFHRSQFSTLKEILEYDAAGSIRRTWQGVTNGQPVKQQSITVGLISYNKIGDAKWTWKEKEPARLPAHITPFESQSNTLSPFTVEHERGAQFEFNLGPWRPNGRDALVYTRIKRTNRPPTSGTSLIHIEIITKYWLGADGRVVKLEQWDNHRSDRSAESLYISIEWELDPTVVIRAPIIEP